MVRAGSGWLERQKGHKHSKLKLQSVRIPGLGISIKMAELGTLRGIWSFEK